MSIQQSFQKYLRRGVFQKFTICENAQNDLKSRISQTFGLGQRKCEKPTYNESHELSNCYLNFIMCI